MSFNKVKDIIEEGDVVVLYLGPTNMHSLQIKPQILNKKGNMVDNVFQTTYGALKVISLVGQKYGTKVQLSRGWGYVLQPTPELWTLTVPHRTQILYSPDISLIIYLMDLAPGSIVIETEFERHGLKEYVTVNQKDVCIDGFGEELKYKVDAIFLDLPHPWLAIDHALCAFKKSGGKLCSFSPCIEQVQRTCLKLVTKGFIELNTYECLQREVNVQYKNLPILDLECLKHEVGQIVATYAIDIVLIVLYRLIFFLIECYLCYFIFVEKYCNYHCTNNTYFLFPKIILRS
ncbi:tRNA methyltransferase 61 isoform X3 [Nomia melanderi]|uniref:tRNA methyltransferase 61 isoform X3 n=1 Tax=Nomia melanderi TaxID=2448451 RepID=UPI003FCDD2F8